MGEDMMISMDDLMTMTQAMDEMSEQEHQEMYGMCKLMDVMMEMKKKGKDDMDDMDDDGPVDLISMTKSTFSHRKCSQRGLIMETPTELKIANKCVASTHDE